MDTDYINTYASLFNSLDYFNNIYVALFRYIFPSNQWWLISFHTRRNIFSTLTSNVLALNDRAQTDNPLFSHSSPLPSPPNATRLERAAQHELEKDSADKYRALQYENAAHQVRNTSIGLAYHDGIERVDNT